jgi:hypothetical protein
MQVALQGSYVEFVTFMGVAEKYPPWFQEVLYSSTYMDNSRYTLYIDKSERRPDYYEKKLIENYSIFIRKPNGETHVTDLDVFQDLYVSFRYNVFTNSGIAALEEDTIEYIEYQPGVSTAEYPLWFYEYYTEAKHHPNGNRDAELLVGTSIPTHCVFLRNKFGEIRGMKYSDFIKYYDIDPKVGDWV